MPKQSITQQEEEYLLAQQHIIDQKDQEATEDLKDALSQGGETWHDNSVYDVAQAEKQQISTDRSNLREALRTTKVIKPIQNPKTVTIGTLVEYEDLEKAQIFTKKLGGRFAAYLGDDWISIYAPVAKLLLTHKAGDTVNGKISGVSKSYRIISINEIP